jgi:hypothetical protein
MEVFHNMMINQEFQPGSFISKNCQTNYDKAMCFMFQKVACQHSPTVMDNRCAISSWILSLRSPSQSHVVPFKRPLIGSLDMWTFSDSLPFQTQISQDLQRFPGCQGLPGHKARPVLQNLSFIDIGCGSGIHSAAALFSHARSGWLRIGVS